MSEAPSSKAIDKKIKPLKPEPAESRETVEVHRRITGETPNGLPFTTLPVGKEIEINGATIRGGLYFQLPEEFVPDAAGLEEPAALMIAEKTRTRRVLEGIGKGMLALGAVTGAAALAGCDMDSGNNSNSIGKNNGYKTYKAGLTSAQADNLGERMEACFTEPGDKKVNIGTFNGETVVTFIRQHNGMDKCFYVKAADLETALTTECEAQMIDL